ncbi:hypothetical protein AURDEDRAFT_158924 [Auricularia subglabra TFB-10046 SS5]|nr:hypothetical protein AURDEDRAFT_158924 [Auricularia subglabra TFB-10046 SS5]
MSQPAGGNSEEQMLELLTALKNDKFAWPIQQPVNLDEVPDCYEVIKNPMASVTTLPTPSTKCERPSHNLLSLSEKMEQQQKLRKAAFELLFCLLPLNKTGPSPPADDTCAHMENFKHLAYKDKTPHREPPVAYDACDPLAFDKTREHLRSKGIVSADEPIINLLQEAPSSTRSLSAYEITQYCIRTQYAMATFAAPDHNADHCFCRHNADTTEETDLGWLLHQQSYMHYELESGLRRETFNIAEEIKAIANLGRHVPSQLFGRFKVNLSVLHLVYCWGENDKITIGTLGKEASAVRSYCNNTRFLRAWIARCFKAPLPTDDYNMFDSAYHACPVVGSGAPGTFLAQVLLWKSESHAHRDSLDGQ